MLLLDKDSDEYPEEYKTSKALERLADVVERIGKAIPPKSKAIDLSPVVEGIRAELKALTSATLAATESRKKQFTFTPEYDHYGRIEKITVE